MKKIKVFQLIGMIILAQAVYGQTNKKFIIIAYGSKLLTGNCNYKSNALPYKYVLGYGNQQTIEESKYKLKNSIADMYGINPFFVIMESNWSTDYPIACIIKYTKDKGKECEAQHYAIRFGEDAKSAKSNAITEMRLFYKGDDHSVVDMITYANTESEK